jgi:hypothetical protein
MSEQERPQAGKFEEDEVQQGESRSIAKQEALKHIKKQHPQRDIPKVGGEESEHSE